MSTAEDDETIKDIALHSLEARRLKTLSDIDLIRECMKSEVSEDLIVQELMDRVRPGWLKEL